MQTSSSFRLLSAAVAIFLLAALVLVIRLVILSNSSGIVGSNTEGSNIIGSSTTINTRTQTPTPLQLTLTRTESLPSRTANATRAPILAPLNLSAARLTATDTPTTILGTRATSRATTVTQTPTETRPKPTRTSTRLPTQQPTTSPTLASTETVVIPQATQPTGRWWLYSNANFVNDVALLGDTLWMATGGGVVALNQTEGRTVKYTTLNGLSHNHVRVAESCLLPGMGIIFGAETGLQIFDIENEQWISWTSSNSSLFFDDISALYCDAENGFLIIGYEDNGLDILDTIAGTWTHLDDSSILADNGVHHIAVVGNQESIWIVSDSGITGVTPVAGLGDNPNAVFYSTIHYDLINSPLETTDIQAIAAHEDGTVWLGASNRLYRLQDQSWTIYNSDTVLQSEFPTSEIHHLSLEPDGTLWIGSDIGEICRFDPLFDYCVEFFQSATGMAAAPLTSLIAPPTGGVIYSTAGNGISRYDGSSWAQQTISYEVLNSNYIYDIVQSQDGAIWIATDLGIQRLRAESGILTGQDVQGSGTDTVSEDNSLSDSKPHVLFPDIEEGIWSGIAGLHYYNDSGWLDYTVADGLVGPNVQAIAMDSLKRLWIGTDVGLSILSDKGFFNLAQEAGLPNQDIRAAISVGESMWLGTNGGGLLRFVDNQLQFFNMDNAGLPSNQITALAQADEEILWVGTDQGLTYFSDNQATLIPAVPSTAVTAIATTKKGNVWVGTDNAGIFYFDSEKWTQFTTADGLPTQYITALLVDREGTLWIGGKSGGMVRYVP